MYYRYTALTVLIIVFATALTFAAEPSADPIGYFNTLFETHLNILIKNHASPSNACTAVKHMYETESKNIRTAREAIVVLRETDKLIPYIRNNFVTLENALRKHHTIAYIYKNNIGIIHAFAQYSSAEEAWTDEALYILRTSVKSMQRPDAGNAPIRYTAWFVNRWVKVIVSANSKDEAVNAINTLLSKEYHRLSAALSTLDARNDDGTLSDYTSRADDSINYLKSELALKQTLLETDTELAADLEQLDHNGLALYYKIMEYLGLSG